MRLDILHVLVLLLIQPGFSVSLRSAAYAAYCESNCATYVADHLGTSADSFYLWSYCETMWIAYVVWGLFCLELLMRPGFSVSLSSAACAAWPSTSLRSAAYEAYCGHSCASYVAGPLWTSADSFYLRTYCESQWIDYVIWR